MGATYKFTWWPVPLSDLSYMGRSIRPFWVRTGKWAWLRRVRVVETLLGDKVCTELEH